MTKSPTTVQQWVDMLPQPHHPPSPNTNKSTPKNRHFSKELSTQSDDASSHCSSVESVLELRRPDPEAVLIGLGFGPPKTVSRASRIPQRFLQPSQLLSHIDIEKFLERQSELQISNTSYTSAPPSPAHVRPKTC